MSPSPDRPEPSTTDDTPEERSAREPGASFPIVGVGASAGGLEAFTELLKALPLDTGMGFVLVQHLDPAHESALTQLLARATKLPVCEVTNNQRVEANSVYVIPPNTNLSITHGVLTLQPRGEARRPARSIDFFLESLAQDQRERAIGVILSGTATDGTLGLEAIKAEGGITFAQDESARYDSMPKSAAAAGCVDFVLSPKVIAHELARIAKHPYVAGAPSDADSTSPEKDRAFAAAHVDDETPLPSGGRGAPRTQAAQARAEARAAGDAGDDGFRKILGLLRKHSGVDFSLYKSTTIQRRVTRRMVLNRHETLAAYAAFLSGNEKELDALYSDVLISVTSFFRNPDAFDVLTHTVFPKLVREHSDEPLRVWVLGCSTGQEAYSIAMAFAEAAQAAPRVPKLQVFATDLNEALLEKARHGLYAKSLANDVSPERLRRFFVEEDGGYRITKALREMVVFARHNLVSDPPFSRMDLISCRNLLIYLEPSLQKKALPTFHYALKPEGFLFLGASESIGGFTDLFEPADKKHKIYSKKAAPTRGFHLPVRQACGEASAHPSRSPQTAQPDAPDDFRTELNAQHEADRLTVNRYAPPGVLINAELQILQFRGPTGAYLEPPPGKASFDVLKMAREGLMLPLRAAIEEAKKENRAARRDRVRVQQEDGQSRPVSVEVIPLKNMRERCFLIVFEEAKKSTPAQAREATPGARVRGAKAATLAAQEEARRSVELETELAETRDYLQAIQEQHEAANEELQASNEEVQSANEELQSINEELETSKEELESSNEELNTVNEEMSHRNVELNRLNNDLINLQTSTRLTIVLLGRDLTIRRFSAQAQTQFDLLAADIGKPIGHIRHNLVLTDAAQSALDLEGLSAEVISSLREQECQVKDRAGRWHALRVRPYITLENKVDGAVLVLVDIDALKRSEQVAAAARDYAENIIATVHEPLLVLDRELRVESANHAFYQAFRVTPAETIGKHLFDLGNRQWDIPRLRALLGDILPGRTSVENFQIDYVDTLGKRIMLLNARRMIDPVRKTERILLALEDVTERKRAEEVLRGLNVDLLNSERRFREVIDALPAAVYTTDAAGRLTHFNPAVVELVGRTPVLGSDEWCVSWKLFHADGTPLAHDESPMAIAIREGREIRGVEAIVERPDGTRVWGVPYPTPLRNSAGEIVGAINMIVDITERKHAEEALRESEAFNRTVLESSPDCVKVLDAEGRLLTMNEAGQCLLGIDDFADFRGKAWEEMWPSEGRARIVAAVNAVKEGTADRFQAFSPTVKGTPKWWDVIVAPVRDDTGRINRLVSVSRDITEQREMADALRRNAAVMSETDRHKNEFLAILAHELRNPLAPLRHALQILRLKEGESQAVLDVSAMMERQVLQMVRLVDDLLDSSRISRGTIELRIERLDLAAVIHDAAEAAGVLCERMDHQLSVAVPPAPIYLNGDPARLVQVVGNLLTNACKFTDRGGRISLTAERDGGQALIRVRDSGVGIAQAELPRIFDMFSQVHTSLAHSAGGLGIGLTLVKHIVELHAGTVEVHSAGLGHGSELIVRLPIAPDTAKPRAEPRVSEPLPLIPRRILVVDDNLDAAQALAELLELSDHVTHMAHDGLEAMERAAAFKPEVVLLDIGLPGMNGFEVARRMREAPWGGDITLVALTGWGQEEDRRKSTEAGFDAHLVKPVDYDVLMDLLAELRPRNPSDLRAADS